MTYVKDVADLHASWIDAQRMNPLLVVNVILSSFTKHLNKEETLCDRGVRYVRKHSTVASRYLYGMMWLLFTCALL